MIDTFEFLSLATRLDKYHAVFYWLWTKARPQFSNIIPTAAVSFDARNGDYLDFLINPDYWKVRTDSQKEFLICHEILHVILNHGLRGIPLDNRELANIAMDLVVNQSLVDRFGFNIDDIDPNRNYCWIERYFPNNPNISKTENFEYYYKLLRFPGGWPSDAPAMANSGSGKNVPGKLVDDHSTMTAADFSAILEEIAEKLTEEEVQKIKEFVEKQDSATGGTHAGSAAGSLTQFINKVKVIKKKKWETIIKKWANKYIHENTKHIEQWARTARRFEALPKDLCIPSEMETDELIEERFKIRVWFFLDTSGSCSHLAKRFFLAAESLPTNRFDIKLFCFDTSVYETDFKTRKLYGFGGTSFTCIERYIRSNTKEELNYPKAVFVITDGYGDRVSPLKPERWYWFLSEDCRNCIPTESNIFMLKDFE